MNEIFNLFFNSELLKKPRASLFRDITDGDKQVDLSAGFTDLREQMMRLVPPDSCQVFSEVQVTSSSSSASSSLCNPDEHLAACRPCGDSSDRRTPTPLLLPPRRAAADATTSVIRAHIRSDLAC